MPPPGHDPLTRHLGTPRWCALAVGARAVRLPAITGMKKTWSCTTAASVPGEAMGQSRARTTHLAGNGARTAGPSPGPEGDR
jgi:hypothetical protein